jgi:conflict system STAND superfamily ATPase
MTATATPPAAAPPIPAPPRAGDKPYKGPEPYCSEDAHLFYGRDAAADQVIAKILASRFMLLHAPSGAGKTSLLNARVLTGLESRGWMPVRVTPQHDPSAAIRSEIFRQILPPPVAEAKAVLRAVDALAEPGEPIGIGDLLDRYDQLAPRDERRRRLVAPVGDGLLGAVQPSQTGRDSFPFFCRLLRSSITEETFDEHLGALSEDSFRSVIDLHAADLVAELSSTRFERSYASLVKTLAAPASGLREFFERWWSVWGSRHNRYAIVLVFDQFEEVFTRFADPGPVPAQAAKRVLDWRVREAFFGELRELYERGTPAARESGAAPAQPLAIRYVISLRDEYVAQLDPIRCFVWDLDASAYHLGLLTVDEATNAIEMPARNFGYTYADACFKDIVEKLAKEERFVEPAHVQIVCEKLWATLGRELAARPAPIGGDGDALPEIDYETYAALNGARGILRRFILEVLERFGDDRVEVLEMLEALITPSGTRNIVERSYLVQRPLRDPDHRERLLGQLEKQSIVRAQWRLGSQFVEITHEFLIEPVLRAIREELYGAPDNARFVAARRILERLTMSSVFRTDERMLLNPRELETLLENAARIRWDALSAEVMLRSVTVNADAGDADAAARVQGCATRYELARATELLSSEERAAAVARGTPAVAAPNAGPSDTEEEQRPPTSERHVAAVIGDYLKSGSAKLRGNALRALAAYGGAEAVARLVHVALGDDEELKWIARAELLKLEGDPQHVAIAALKRAMDDPATRRPAYKLLGELHARGADVVLPRRSLRERLALVLQPIGDGVPRWRSREAWRPLQPGLASGAVGLVIGLVLLFILHPDGHRPWIDGALSLMVSGLLLGSSLLVLAATRRSDPIQLHVDQRAASATEITRAAAGAAGVALLIAVVFGLQGVAAGTTAFRGTLVVWLAALIVATVAAVRAGTLVAYEAFSAEVNRNWLGQWITGTLAGLATIALGCTVIAVLAPDASRAGDDALLLLKVAIYLVPACFALAGAFAARETAAPPRRPIFGRAARRVSVAIIAGVLVLMMVTLVRGRRQFDAQGMAGGGDGFPSVGKGTYSQVIDALPARVVFTVDTLTPDSTIAVFGGVPGRAWYPGELELELWDVSGRNARRVDYSARPPEFDVPLKRQPYRVDIRAYGEVPPPFEAAARALLIRLAPPDRLRSRMLGIGVKPVQPFLLRLELASKINARRDSAAHARSVADSAIEPAGTPAGARFASVALANILDAWRADSIFAVTASDLNDVCWAAALNGLERQALPICERAVVLDSLGAAQPDSIDRRIGDSRGLALALLGERDRAIRDFEAYMVWARRQPDSAFTRPERGVRRRWIEQLRLGRGLNPDSVRAQLRAADSAVAERRARR